MVGRKVKWRLSSPVPGLALKPLPGPCMESTGWKGALAIFLYHGNRALHTDRPGFE